MKRDVFQAISDPTRRRILALLLGQTLHLNAVAEQGISYEEVVDQLETEGLKKFDKSWDELLATVRTALDEAR